MYTLLGVSQLCWDKTEMGLSEYSRYLSQVTYIRSIFEFTSSSKGLGIYFMQWRLRSDEINTYQYPLIYQYINIRVFSYICSTSWARSVLAVLCVYTPQAVFGHRSKRPRAQMDLGLVHLSRLPRTTRLSLRGGDCLLKKTTHPTLLF